MTLAEFETSLTDKSPPSRISLHLQALWFDGKNDWDKAHTIAQDIEDRNGSWVHAYLHRREGDLGNASYWYNRAGRKMPGYSLQEEWREIVKNFLINP